MAWPYDLRTQRLGPCNGRVEFVDLEPEKKSVSRGQVVGIADPPVMIF